MFELQNKNYTKYTCKQGFTLFVTFLHPENKQIALSKTVVKCPALIFIDDRPTCCHEQANDTGKVSSSTSF